MPLSNRPTPSATDNPSPLPGGSGAGAGGGSSSGFLKLMRGEATVELMKDPKAFTLLALIAYRARREGGISLHNLKPGESLIGDYDACGFTEGEYRATKQRLAAWGFITCRTTNKGTIARLINTVIFDANTTHNNGQNDTPTTGQRRTNDGRTTGQQRLTRIKEGEEGEKRKEGEGAAARTPFSDDGWDLGKVLEIAASPDVAVTQDMARKCFDHYAAKGWVDSNGNEAGRTISALKSLLRNWKVREPSFAKAHGITPASTPSAPRAKNYDDLVPEVARDLWNHREDDQAFQRVLRTWRDKTKDIPKQDGMSVIDNALDIVKRKRQAGKGTS